MLLTCKQRKLFKRLRKELKAFENKRLTYREAQRKLRIELTLRRTEPYYGKVRGDNKVQGVWK